MAARSTRRELLLGSAALAAGGVLTAAPRSVRAQATPQASPSASPVAPVRDYTTRETYDAMEQAFTGSDAIGQATDLNENGGALAWGQSYVLQSYMIMYDAYRDPVYLDKLVENTDAVLATRDSVRGVVDYRGLSLPAWRAANPYTAGAVVLKDAEGRDTLEVRTTLSYADEAKLTVEAGGQPDTFTLVAENPKFEYSSRFENLSMDPASPDFAVTHILDAFPTEMLVTARDWRPNAEAGGLPVPGAFDFVSQPAIFGVHTGMITYPIAGFVRTVYEDEALRQDARYKAKADEFLEAVEQAVAVHDHEWRENEDEEGFYVFPKGMPMNVDGTEQPANQFLGLGRTMIHLAAITGNPVYRSKAEKMARVVHNDLRVDGGGAYVWNYWLTWGLAYQGWSKEDNVSEFRPSFGGARQIEDISHGHLDVDFAALAYRDGLVYTEEDMQQFALTFAQNVIAEAEDGSPTVWSGVDGTGTLDSLGFEMIAAGWMPVAEWDERIFTHTRDIYAHEQPEGTSGYFLSGTANLNHYAQRGA